MKNAKEYYDDKQQNIFENKDLKRNVHNFIKSVWINRFVKENANILDIGCGHGGDFWKLKHRKPLLYWGVDLSNKALIHALTRCHIFPKSVNFKLTCSDFVSYPEDFSNEKIFDVVVSNFSIHYAFQKEEKAQNCIQCIFDALKTTGFFIGVIPLSDTSYSTHVYKQPDDDRFHEEPTVTYDTFISVCTNVGFTCIEFLNFEQVYAESLISDMLLAKKMKADKTKPDKFYSAFAFQKL